MTIACFMFYSLILTAAGFNLGWQCCKTRLEHKTEPEAHIVEWLEGDEAFEKPSPVYPMI